MMNSLSDIEQSVSQLPDDDFARFRQWFLEFENKKWDLQVEQDINENKLSNMANEALADYKKGKFKSL